MTSFLMDLNMHDAESTSSQGASHRPPSPPMPPTSPQRVEALSLLPAHSPTSQTFHGDNTAHEASTSVLIDEGSTVVADSKQDGEGEDWKAESSMARNVLLPSPSLSRVGTNESGNGTRLDKDTTEGGSVDVVEAEWHPLGHTRAESTDGDVDQTVSAEGLEDEEEDIVTANGRLAFPEGDEKLSPSLPQRGSALLRLDIKSPSPQPWELVDPSPGKGHGGTDFYSTLGSRKFDTLQSQSYVYVFSPLPSPVSSNAQNSRPHTQVVVLLWTTACNFCIRYPSDGSYWRASPSRGIAC
jgi:hypothetical protein